SVLLSLYAQLPDLHYFPTRRSSDLGSLQIDWKYESSIQGYTAKYFEENYGGTKGVVRSYLPDFMPDRKLRNGIPLNFLMYAESVDRKSTRLNSSHVSISYAVFCLKK